jgi:hypothetical protein
MTQYLQTDEEEECARRVMLEACGRALVVLAGSIEEQLDLGYALSAPEIVEIREFAVELMTNAAEILAVPLAPKWQSGEVDRIDRHQLVRLVRALERILDTSASATDFSASLQSAADLICSAPKEEGMGLREKRLVSGRA